MHIDRNTGPGDVQEIGVWDPADGQQEDVTCDLLWPAVHTEVQRDGVVLLLHPLDLRVQENR